jgi:hypothetical protein
MATRYPNSGSSLTRRSGTDEGEMTICHSWLATHSGNNVGSTSLVG